MRGDGWMRCPLIDTRFPGLKSSMAYLTACRAEGGFPFCVIGCLPDKSVTKYHIAQAAKYGRLLS